MATIPASVHCKECKKSLCADCNIHHVELCDSKNIEKLDPPIPAPASGASRAKATARIEEGAHLANFEPFTGPFRGLILGDKRCGDFYEPSLPLDKVSLIKLQITFDRYGQFLPMIGVGLRDGPFLGIPSIRDPGSREWGLPTIDGTYIFKFDPISSQITFKLVGSDLSLTKQLSIRGYRGDGPIAWADQPYFRASGLRVTLEENVEMLGPFAPSGFPLHVPFSLNGSTSWQGQYSKSDAITRGCSLKGNQREMNAGVLVPPLPMDRVSYIKFQVQSTERCLRGVVVCCLGIVGNMGAQCPVERDPTAYWCGAGGYGGGNSLPQEKDLLGVSETGCGASMESYVLKFDPIAEEITWTHTASRFRNDWGKPPALAGAGVVRTVPVSLSAATAWYFFMQAAGTTEVTIVPLWGEDYF